MKIFLMGQDTRGYYSR